MVRLLLVLVEKRGKVAGFMGKVDHLPNRLETALRNALAIDAFTKRRLGDLNSLSVC